MSSSFKEYLEESRMAPLYHGTPLYRGRSILMSNILQAKNEAFEKRDHPFYGKKCVSTTRSLKYAIKFVENYENAENIVVFEFDQRKLAQNYRIKPFNFWNSYRLGNTEYEEVILGDIRNVNSYITRAYIHNSPTYNEDDLPELLNLLKKKRIPVIEMNFRGV
jgi:hypothetical protein